jgi:glutamine---fructose-6-phosphate transaminase (isomerizing)
MMALAIARSWSRSSKVNEFKQRNNPMSEMLNQILSLPELIAAQVPILDMRVRAAFTHAELLSIKEIVLTGCGDSYFAGLGARHFFHRICNIPTRVLPSFEAARYDLADYKSQFPRNPLVMATSVTGKVVRTIESITVAREQNALTLGITGHMEGPLAKASEKTIDCALPPMPRCPGVRSYRMSLLVMYLLGIHLAEVKSIVSQREAGQMRDRLAKTADQLADTIQHSQSKAEDLAKTFKDVQYFVFLGEGPNYPTAYFSAAKVTEACGLIAVPQNAEEWAHLQYFESAFPDAPTFLITNQHRGYPRFLELVPLMKRISRRIVAVAPSDCKELVSAADFVLPVNNQVEDLFSPLVYAAGGELFAAYLADVIHADYFRDDLAHYHNHNNAIYMGESQLMTRAEIKQRD